MSSSEHTFHVIVNGKPKTVTTDNSKELTYQQVVKLDYPDANFDDDKTVYTVTYKKGEGHKHEGELAMGESLKLKDGMIINVRPTDKS